MPLALPPPLSVRNVFEDLLGRDVTVGPDEPIMGSDLMRTAAAVYVDDARKMRAVIGLDIALAAHASAALGLVPVNTAVECVNAICLSDMLIENLNEICNILTGLLNRGGKVHLKLHHVYVPGEEAIPGDVRTPLLALGQRLDLTVEVSRYGGGRFTVALA